MEAVVQGELPVVAVGGLQQVEAGGVGGQLPLHLHHHPDALLVDGVGDPLQGRQQLGQLALVGVAAAVAVLTVKDDLPAGFRLAQGPQALVQGLDLLHAEAVLLRQGLQAVRHGLRRGQQGLGPGVQGLPLGEGADLVQGLEALEVGLQHILHGDVQHVLEEDAGVKGGHIHGVLILQEAPEIDGALALELLAGVRDLLELVILQTEDLGVLLHQVIEGGHHVGESAAGVALQRALDPLEHLRAGVGHAADAAEGADVELALIEVGRRGDEAVGGRGGVRAVHHQLPVPAVGVGALAALGETALVDSEAGGVGDDGVEPVVVAHKVIELVAHAGVLGVGVGLEIPVIGDVVAEGHVLAGTAVGIIMLVLHLGDEEGHVTILVLVVFPDLQVAGAAAEVLHAVIDAAGPETVVLDVGAGGILAGHIGHSGPVVLIHPDQEDVVVAVGTEVEVAVLLHHAAEGAALRLGGDGLQLLGHLQDLGLPGLGIHPDDLGDEVLVAELGVVRQLAVGEEVEDAVELVHVLLAAGVDAEAGGHPAHGAVGLPGDIGPVAADVEVVAPLGHGPGVAVQAVRAVDDAVILPGLGGGVADLHRRGPVVIIVPALILRGQGGGGQQCQRHGQGEQQAAEPFHCTLHSFALLFCACMVDDSQGKPDTAPFHRLPGIIFPGPFPGLSGVVFFLGKQIYSLFRICQSVFFDEIRFLTIFWRTRQIAQTLPPPGERRVRNMRTILGGKVLPPGGICRRGRA